eukprot:4994082-Prymnesium_polylepis.2
MWCCADTLSTNRPQCTCPDGRVYWVADVSFRMFCDVLRFKSLVHSNHARTRVFITRARGERCVIHRLALRRAGSGVARLTRASLTGGQHVRQSGLRGRCTRGLQCG